MAYKEWMIFGDSIEKQTNNILKVELTNLSARITKIESKNFSTLCYKDGCYSLFNKSYEFI